MSLAWRVSVTVVLFAVAAVAAVILIVNLLGSPPTVDFTADSSGQVNVTMQTVGTFGSGSHPTWVSYLVQSPDGQWVHTTLFQVPQHARINVTIYNYDSGSPLRNQQVGQVTGTYGNVATVERQAVPSHQLQRRERGRPHVLDALHRHQRAALRQQRHGQPLRRRSVHHELPEQGRSGSPSPVPARGTTAGSASSRAGWDSSTATVGPCRPSATWADS